MRLRWIAACALAEALGMAVVATVYAALDRGVLEAAASSIVLAGAWEGLCLGAAQAALLCVKGVGAPAWTAATVIAAALGYALSLIGGAGSGPADGAGAPPMALILMMGAGLGAATGLLMGAAQWLAARRLLSGLRWTLANAVGWAVGMAAIMAAATSASPQWPLAGVALSGGLAGALAGLSVGVATAFALPRERAA